MGKAKIDKSEQRANDPERVRAVRRLSLHLAGVVVLLGGLGAAFYSARRYVDLNVAYPSDPPAVVLLNRPAWMSDLVAQRIASGVRPAVAHSTFDHRMLVEIEHMLELNPWIAKVRKVRRVYGQKPGDLLEIDCDYRVPIALVKSSGSYWLVDNDGVRLPERFVATEVPSIVVGRDHKTNIRIIDGVRHLPPKEAGTKWPGDDLAVGLEMVRLLFGRSYAEEVYKVDVTNFAGRVDPRESQIVLVTKYGTAVRWGRPIGDVDNFIEVRPEVKLAYMKKVFDEYGRVDARQPWIDIRFDKITYPSEAAAAHADGR